MGKRRSDNHAGILGLPTHEKQRYLKQERKPRGFVARSLINCSLVYVLYYLLYACPSGVPDSQAPQVCHRYYNLKQVIATKAVPHLQPYYEQYAGPYVAKGKPYYDQVNAVYGQYAKPAIDKSGQAYFSYVHPFAQKGANAASRSYNAKLGPVVNKNVANVKTVANKHYEKYIGKHIKTTTTKYNAIVGPYVALAQEKGVQAYNKVLVPTYNKLYPHGRALASKSADVYGTHAHPHVVSIFTWAREFLDKKIMPTIRRYYYLYLQPYVDSISEKIFQLNVATGFASLDKTGTVAVEASVSSSILSTASMSSSVASTVIAGETHTLAAAAPSVDAKLEERIQHGVVDDLLSIAENNIAKEGAAAETALVEKLDDILPAMVKKEEILCEDYLVQLEKVTVEEVDAIEKQIISFAKSETNKGRDTEDIGEELRPYFIRAGKNIHAQAVEVKAHLSTVIDSLQSKVQRATYVVYDQVLAEGQRQKRAPEQKIRYEMDSPTKNELKRLEALDDKIKAVEKSLNAAADRVLKQYTKTLNSLLKDTESKVESLAGGAANKLHTLRTIGPKKITVADDSEQFGHGYLPVGMMLGAQAIYNQISTGIYGEPEPTPELYEQVYESIKSAATDLPNHFNSESILSAASQAASIASEQGVNAASAAASVLADIDTDALSSSAASAASVASKHGSSAYAAASSAAQDVDTDAIYSSLSGAREYVGEQAADIVSGASNVVFGSPPSFTESVISKLSIAVHGTEAPFAESVMSRAQDAYEAASEHIDSLMHGTPVPLTKSIASKASEAIYGTPTPATESIMSAVSDAYEDLKEKAAEFIQGSEEDISIASKSAASASSSLASVASLSSKSLEASASSASVLASKSLASASSVASKSSASLAKSASAASAAASKSASSASSAASKSLASAASAAKSAASDETPIIQSVVDKAWEDYASAKGHVEDVIDNVREHIEL